MSKKTVTINIPFEISYDALKDRVMFANDVFIQEWQEDFPDEKPDTPLDCRQVIKMCLNDKELMNEYWVDRGEYQIDINDFALAAVRKFRTGL